MLTPFEAVCIAIGGTVGFGNIAGVATAVASESPYSDGRASCRERV